MNHLRSPLVVCLVVVSGCGLSTTASDAGATGSDGGADTNGSVLDSGRDAGVAPDVGVDAANIDSGGRRDVGLAPPAHHRPDDSQCVAAAPPGNCTFGGGACHMDSDCMAGVNGRCNMTTRGAVFCHCTYDTCMRDANCPTGQTCACHGAAGNPDSNQCIASGNCRVDSDCASGFCSPNSVGCGGLAGYYCHTANDLCTNDTDCADTTTWACKFSATTARWECDAQYLCV